MVRRMLDALKANGRDLALAGFAAGAGFVLGRELPKTGVEVKALLVGVVYAAARAVVALAALRLKKLLDARKPAE